MVSPLGLVSMESMDSMCFEGVASVVVVVDEVVAVGVVLFVDRVVASGVVTAEVVVTATLISMGEFSMFSPRNWGVFSTETTFGPGFVSSAGGDWGGVLKGGDCPPPFFFDFLPIRLASDGLYFN